MKQPTRSATERAAALGIAMAHAIAEQDAKALRSLFATHVVFRAVTPRRFWDADTPMGVSDIVLGAWFDATKTVTALTSLETGDVGGVARVGYAMTVDLPTGPAAIEQVAFYDEQDGRISQMRVLCSGFCPV